jgi:hypothetical protein
MNRQTPLPSLLIMVALTAALLAFPVQASPMAQEGCPSTCSCGCVCAFNPGPPASQSCTCNVCGTVSPPTDGGTALPTHIPLPTATPLPVEWADYCTPTYCDVTFCARYGCPEPYYRPVKARYTIRGDFVAILEIGDCNAPPCNIPEGGDDDGEAGECIIDGSGILNDAINCAGEYEVSVSLSLPVWHADRTPYPRSMVRVASTFYAVDAPAAEAWSGAVNIGQVPADGVCDSDSLGVTRGWQIGLRTESVFDPPSPHWDAEECGSFDGPVGSCAWSRSSWGKPELGVGEHGEPLPAYAVTAWLPYNWFSRTRWETCERVVTGAECQCHGGAGVNECTGQEGLCIHAPDTEHWVRVEQHDYQWKPYDTGWEFIDLRLFGYATSWMPNPNVQQQPTALDPDPPVGALYVPVIEVQSIIEQ